MLTHLMDDQPFTQCSSHFGGYNSPPVPLKDEVFVSMMYLFTSADQIMQLAIKNTSAKVVGHKII